MQRTKATRNDKQGEYKWRSPESRARAAKAGAANLAAYRASVNGKPALTHGVQSFLNGGSAPSEITDKLAAYEAGLLSDLGNEPSTAQRALVETTCTALRVYLLARSYLLQGPPSQLKKKRWVFQTLATYLNTTRLNLLALGLERRAKDLLTVDAVLADIAEKRQEGHD